MAYQQDLQEKDFIQESFSKNPFPIWLWIIFLTVITSLILGGALLLNNRMSCKYSVSPFLQVTNREFSLFLWQFPEYMRANASRKTGYLTGFQYGDKIGIIPGEAENWVVAPPELLFLYHTWNRLIGSEMAQRPIPKKEFQEFLNYAEEWKPRNWSKAPQQYIELINHIEDENIPQNLGNLPELPKTVRQAFQGWKNFFKEGVAINEIKPTYEEMNKFLKDYPHYSRNYWKNLIYSNYLHSESQIPSFLKVAFFNYFQEKN